MSLPAPPVATAAADAVAAKSATVCPNLAARLRGRSRSRRVAPAAVAAFSCLAAVVAGSVAFVTPAAAASPGKRPVEGVAASPGRTAYRQALLKYRAGDYVAALRLLDAAVPASASGADVRNLRGAIFLRQRQFARAREEFTASSKSDPSLWEAAYNVAETDFRQGRYEESRRGFESLLRRADTAREREFLRYKILLAGLMAGQEEPVVRYLASMAKRTSRPPAYFYLSAALARRRGGSAESANWLAQAGGARAPAPAKRVYAASFRALGWGEASGSAAESAETNRLSPAAARPSPVSPARVAVVQLYRPSAPPPSRPSAATDDVPASGEGMAELPVAFRLGAAPADLPIPLASPAPGRSPRPPAAAAGTNSPSSAAGTGAPMRPGASPSPAPQPTEAFNAKYELAYRAYAQRDFATALRLLDEAEEAQPGLADSFNLRGLIFSRQRRFEEAETAYRKAVSADPTFWAAKFNLSELPFGYKNYTEARKRFEGLLADTNPAVQPREAELTEFKVFLTLLLEGKESAARSYMQRFKPDGATPARFYSQAAMDFHAGKFDRAIESVNAAKKNYPATLEAIFAESFYRIGWLTDTKAGSVAVAAPPPESSSPPPPPTSEPTPVSITLTEAPTSGSPAAPEASATPALAAAATTPPDPVAAAPLAIESPGPTTPVAPAPAPIAAATPGATATPPAIPDLLAQPSSTPAPSASPAGARAPASPSPEPEAQKERPAAEQAIRVGIPVVVLLYMLGTSVLMARVVRARNHRSKARRVRPTTPEIAESSKV